MLLAGAMRWQAPDGAVLALEDVLLDKLVPVTPLEVVMAGAEVTAGALLNELVGKDEEDGLMLDRADDVEKASPFVGTEPVEDAVDLLAGTEELPVGLLLDDALALVAALEDTLTGFERWR